MTNQEAIEITKSQLFYWKQVIENYPENKTYKNNIESARLSIKALEKEGVFSKDKITRLGQELCKQNRPKEDVYNMFEKGVQTMTVALLKMLKEE